MNIFHGTYCISYVRERFSCLYVYYRYIVNCIYYVQLALRLLWADFVNLCQMLYVCKKMSLCSLDECKINVLPWWRHQMETFSASAALCAGNSPAIGEFPSQRPVTLSFDVFFDLCLNKRLSKHSWRRWFETPFRSLWRHCNVLVSRWCHHTC